MSRRAQRPFAQEVGAIRQLRIALPTARLWDASDRDCAAVRESRTCSRGSPSRRGARPASPIHPGHHHDCRQQYALTVR